MTAYYNEFDPQVAAWLRVLIAEGHIAPGVVDERSIEDVRPSDLEGFTQCHFFAGIGVWSYALRLAGWPDDRPVWTGSCPCQPFSAAGKGAGFNDERHLWPAFHYLIQQRRPANILGEQVASAAVDDWIDLVHTDMEALGYAFGSVPFPAAGVGAPHIRDRNYWVAHADSKRSTGQRILLRPEESGREPRHILETAGCGAIGGLANTLRKGSLSSAYPGIHRGEESTGAWDGEPERLGSTGRMGNASGQGLDERERERGILGGTSGAVKRKAVVGAGIHVASRPGPTNGFWRDADWLGCRDGKWRPVEPGTFPLVTGAAARVVRLRGYGNAVNAEQARAWIETVMAY